MLTMPFDIIYPIIKGRMVYEQLEKEYQWAGSPDKMAIRMVCGWGLCL